MVHDSLRNLRLDRRLLHRRGWLSEQEQERELAALPDVSEKIAPPEQELEQEPSPAAAPGEAES